MFLDNFLMAILVTQVLFFVTLIMTFETKNKYVKYVKNLSHYVSTVLISAIIFWYFAVFDGSTSLDVPIKIVRYVWIQGVAALIEHVLEAPKFLHLPTD